MRTMNIQSVKKLYEKHRATCYGRNLMTSAMHAVNKPQMRNHTLNPQRSVSPKKISKKKKTTTTTWKLIQKLNNAYLP